jgi:hypothetical protein
MSVLHLRRDMVVVEQEPVVEIDKPFPLRTIDNSEIEAEAHSVEDDHHDDGRAPGRTFFQTVRLWLNILGAIIVVLAYPAMMMMASDVGDRNVSSLVDRTRWTAPWAGGAATLMEDHFVEYGWASDAPSWTPMARLTGKPAYQSAMAGALGEFITLQQTQMASLGLTDPDLTAAARLVTQNSTAIQLRAARDSLVSYDRRLRRRASAVANTPMQIADQLGMLSGWAVEGQARVAAAAESGNGPFDAGATRAVYGAKGVAMAAYTVIDTMHWPDAAKAADQRAAALQAWKDAAEFHPMFVINGSTDGSLFGNHAASMGFLLTKAQKATDEFAAAVRGASAAPIIAPAVTAPAK